MALKLPDLAFDPRTRTGNEKAIYYNLGVGFPIGQIVRSNGETIKVQAPDCQERTLPDTGFVAYVLNRFNKAAVGDIPAQYPTYAAVEVDGIYTNDIDDYDLTLTQDGDGAVFWCHPNPADDVLICYDNGFTASPGNNQRAVPRKFERADHYVQQRIEGSMTLNDLLVNGSVGLQRIRNRPITLVVKTFPDGLYIPCDITYYHNAMINPQSDNWGGDGNGNVEISGDGNFSWMSRFAAVDA